MKLRTGYTTGSCAQGAAKASAIMLLTKKLLEGVEIETPSGVKLHLPLIDPEIGDDYAKCGIVKDSGDDPDVTRGTKIYAEVKFSEERGITIKGAEGVGKVTKPGLAIPVGEYAINPVPRRMIIKELMPYLPKEGGLEVIISVPEGKELAKQTFNPRLGIVGGISIIGTTGIVEPKSTDAYKASLSLQLDVLKAQGYKKATLVLGYVGERFCKEVLKLESDSIIKIGDHVGFILSECVKKKIEKVLLVGYIGKLIKVANGQFNTHIRYGDNRIETMAHYAMVCGAKEEVSKQILKQSTTEATIDILRKNGLTQVFGKIAKDIVIKINGLTDNRLCVSCILLSLQGVELATYPKEKKEL